MSSRCSCLPLVREGRHLGCRAFPSRCLPPAIRSRPAAAATTPRTTVGRAEGRRPHMACEAFWTGWQTSPEDQQEAPRLLAGLFGQRKAATADDNEERGSSAGAMDAWLGALALVTFALFAVIVYKCLQPLRNLPNLLLADYIIRTRLWSPTAMTRTAVALKAPLPLVRLLTIVRALDLNAIVGDDLPHTALIMACQTGNTKRIPGLLSLGARPDVAPTGESRPLLIASHLGNTEAVENLLRAGANPNFLPGDSSSPLQAACCRGHAGVVWALGCHGPAWPGGPVLPARVIVVDEAH